jgi:hypothetical protein
VEEGVMSRTVVDQRLAQNCLVELCHTREPLMKAEDELDRFVDWWGASLHLTHEESGDRLQQIGSAALALVHWADAVEDGVHPSGILDDIEADMGLMGEVLFTSEGHLAEDVVARLEVAGGPLLLPLRCEIAGHMRGSGLGLVLAGHAVDPICGGCSGVFCYPAPLEDLPGVDRASAVRKLTRYWARLGFEPVRDGVMVLDPGTTTLREALDGLVQA